MMRHHPPFYVLGGAAPHRVSSMDYIRYLVCYQARTRYHRRYVARNHYSLRGAYKY